MANLKKYKDVCVVDEDNIFVSIARSYLDPKDPTRYLVGESSLDVEPPLVDKLQKHVAKWDNEEKRWKYILRHEYETNPEAEEKFEEPPQAPIEGFTEESAEKEAMDILYFVRENRLKDTDPFVLVAYEKGTEVPKYIQEYRQKLRDIPNKIREGKFEKPVLSDVYKTTSENVRRTKATDLIVFNHWPKTPDKITHGL